MNILDAVFRNNKTYTATVLSNTGSMSNGIQGPKTWTRGTSFECLFWRSGMAGTMFSQMFKSDVSAYLVARPSDVDKTDLPAGCRVIIEDAISAPYLTAEIATQMDKDQDRIYIDNLDPSDGLSQVVAGDIVTIDGNTNYIVTGTDDSEYSTIIIDPVLTAIISNDTDVIVSKPYTEIDTYEVIYADDVAGQGQVLNVSLKEI
jgi:hypothetical protein